MKPPSKKEDRLAILIDADNAQPAIIEGLMQEVAHYGVASVKRIYGDWTTPQLSGWKSALNSYAISPLQQFSYTSGKNSTDSAMIIDAMDLLYTGNFDGFCLISSDSDFTRLASRIRESGLKVYGFGEKKTPKPFVSACDKFIYTEILRKDEPKEQSKSRDGNAKTLSSTTLKKNSYLINLLANAVDDASDDTGWAYLGKIGRRIANQYTDFDPRNYGYRKLGELFEATELFEIQDNNSDDLFSHNREIYIRKKRSKRGRK